MIYKTNRLVKLFFMIYQILDPNENHERDINRDFVGWTDQHLSMSFIIGEKYYD